MLGSFSNVKWNKFIWTGFFIKKDFVFLKLPRWKITFIMGWVNIKRENWYGNVVLFTRLSRQCTCRHLDNFYCWFLDFLWHNWSTIDKACQTVINQLETSKFCSTNQKRARLSNRWEVWKAKLALKFLGAQRRRLWLATQNLNV